jgi:adenylate cyclase
MGLAEAAAIVAGTMEGVAKPGAICLSEDAYRQVQQRLDLKVSDLGRTVLKNIAQPVRVCSLEAGQPAERKPKAPTSGPAGTPPGLPRPSPPFCFWSLAAVGARRAV